MIKIGSLASREKGALAGNSGIWLGLPGRFVELGLWSPDYLDWDVWSTVEHQEEKRFNRSNITMLQNGLLQDRRPFVYLKRKGIHARRSSWRLTGRMAAVWSYSMVTVFTTSTIVRQCSCETCCTTRVRALRATQYHYASLAMAVSSIPGPKRASFKEYRHGAIGKYYGNRESGQPDVAMKTTTSNTTIYAASIEICRSRTTHLTIDETRRIPSRHSRYI